MSRRDDRVSLVDMRNYAAEAVELTEGISLHKLFEDRVRQLALLKLVETVGEAAANRVSETAKQKHKTIPWPQIIRSAQPAGPWVRCRQPRHIMEDH